MELEHFDDDPVERLLAEVEARFGARSPSGPCATRTSSSSSRVGEDPDDDHSISVRLPGGRGLPGNWLEVVRQMRDEAGFRHEPSSTS
jgi:hypothetical protein